MPKTRKTKKGVTKQKESEGIPRLVPTKEEMEESRAFVHDLTRRDFLETLSKVSHPLEETSDEESSETSK